jgi:anaerobic ribonucleoside-triphosphate reductase activating protein
MTPLKIAATMVSTGVNGPGRRFVIWLQGCSIRCQGCFNPEFWDTRRGESLSVADLLARISSAPEVEGVTFTGGEPLEQAQALLPLAQAVQCQGLSIFCYTGYVYEDILQGKPPYAQELLRWVDILVDGPFQEEAQAPLLWRGSRNQQVHFLTDRYRHLAPLAEAIGCRQTEIQVGETDLNITGIFEKTFWQRLQNRLETKDAPLPIPSRKSEV